MAGITFGGKYEILRAERGFVGTKVAGHLNVNIGKEIPICKQCGREMQFLLQLTLQAPPDQFRMALVFLCAGGHRENFDDCDSSEPDLGGNAVILLKSVRPIEPVGSSFTQPFGIRWTQREDIPSVPPGADLLDADIIEAYKERERFVKEYGYTKLAGIPLWLQEPRMPKCAECGGNTVFAAQFSSELGFGTFGEHYKVPLGKFGVGYLFLCARQCSDRGGAFLWQSE